MDKQVKIDEAYHRDLCALSKQFNRTQKEFIEECITYFKTTGQDPKEISADNIVVHIKKLDKKMVSFFKVQEKEKIDPLLDELSVIAKSFAENFQNLPTKKEIAEIRNAQTNMGSAFQKLVQIISQKK